MSNTDHTTKRRGARSLSLEILLRCESGGYSNITLDTAIKRNDLSGADRALLTALTYGVIERRLTLDYIISALSSIPDSKIERETRMILRLGIYQLRYMSRIPTFAAINETVELAGKRSKGFVNAILRAYTRCADTIIFPDRSEPTRYISVRYSVGESLADALISAYGLDGCEAMLAAFEEDRSLTLRANTLRCTRDELLCELRDSGISARPTAISPDGIVLEGAAVSDLACLADGRATVQDEASQICVRALGAVRGETVYDVCACPGSKSFGAAMTMENSGAILDFDIHENKLSLVKSGAERLGIDIISTCAADARVRREELVGGADRVICDVPCSGFGVIGKKPEIRYKDIKECAALPAIQYDILENVSAYLRCGGTLVYSTCTVLPEENERNIERFLAAHPEYSAEPFCVGSLKAESGMITLLPSTHGTDGFFIARLKRTR